MAGSRPTLTFRLLGNDEDRIERIRQKIAKRNPEWAKQGISDAGVIRHCLMACDPGESDD